MNRFHDDENKRRVSLELMLHAASRNRARKNNFAINIIAITLGLAIMAAAVAVKYIAQP